MPIRFLLFLTLFFTASSIRAQNFDWTILNGKWAESVNSQFGCRPENLHHHFVISEDRKRLTFKLDRKWKIGTGKRVEAYTASVLSARPNVLIIKYGAELQGLPEEMREWELRFIGPGTYRWRATAWPEGQYNEVVGVKCSQK